MAQERLRQDLPSHSKRSSGLGMGLVAVLVALIFIVGPFVVPVDIGGLAQTILVGFGVVLLTIGSIVVVITRLYQKAAANEAFVKTGMGGKKAIIDGGAIVVPVVHQLVWVMLDTMKLEIDRRGKDALLTNDKLRADIRAEFYIRVTKTAEGVLQAASSLGSRCSDPSAVMQLVEAKLVSALRAVAATMKLEELNEKRNEFSEKVQGMVSKDIEHNGYMLESVTISHLDQAPPAALDPENNVFDAEGARRIAEITSAARVQRNKLMADAEQEVTTQNVAKDKFIFEQQIQRAAAKADQDRQITEVQATTFAAAATVAAQQDGLRQVAEVTRDQVVQTAQVAREQAIEVANQEKQKAVQTAEISRLQATEVADRQKEVAIANAEKDRAEAEQARIAAEKAREEETQGVKTVIVTAEAERDAKRMVIATQAAADQTRIQRETEARVSAFTVKTQADAEREAAEARAAATIRAAQADKDAATLKAEGDQAVQMVPVQVEQARVGVEQARVQVLKTELEAKKENAVIASELERALRTIEADRDARIAMAQAMGQALASAKMTIWSDPAAFARMTESFLQGQSYGQLLSGVSNAMPPDVKDAALSGIQNLGQIGAGVIKRLTGMDVPVEVVERFIKEETVGAGK
jgi:flotillin